MALGTFLLCDGHTTMVDTVLEGALAEPVALPESIGLEIGITGVLGAMITAGEDVLGSGQWLGLAVVTGDVAVMVCRDVLSPAFLLP
jgi:hypothetical protein